jgi:hypothetical protein
MGLFLFATHYTEQLLSSEFNLMLNFVPGKLLLRIGLIRFGLSADLNQLQYTSEKRPFIPNYPDFNLSHSGNRVVCIFNTRGLAGIDIDCIADLAVVDFQMHFTENEWAIIQGSPIPDALFYQFRTAQESLIKTDGRGFMIPPHEVDVSGSRCLDLGGKAGWWPVPTSLKDLPVISRWKAPPGICDFPAMEFHDLSLSKLSRLQGYAYIYFHSNRAMFDAEQ